VNGLLYTIYKQGFTTVCLDETAAYTSYGHLFSNYQTPTSITMQSYTLRSALGEDLQVN